MSDPDVELIQRVRRLAQAVGAVVGMIAGVLYGTYIVAHSGGAFDGRRTVALAAVLATGAAVATVLGLALPLLSVDPFVGLRRMLREAPAVEIAGAVGGLVVALLISTLVAVLLDRLEWGAGALVTAALAAVLIQVGISTGRQRAEAFAALLRGGRPPARGAAAAAHAGTGGVTVVDTSALIDGRLAGVIAAGFIAGTLVVPGFVLTELREVADSSSSMRRARGRRGLAGLEALRSGGDVVLEVTDGESPVADVDAQLVAVARERGASLLTTDHNLDQAARVGGVRVLNLNRLAAALRPAVGAGDSLNVAVLRAGSEAGQGVGYLDDGTMVVVEGAASHTGSTITAIVDRVLQTPSGRMVFATVRGTGRAESRRSMPAEVARR